MNLDLDVEQVQLILALLEKEQREDVNDEMSDEQYQHLEDLQDAIWDQLPGWFEEELDQHAAQERNR